MSYLMTTQPGPPGPSIPGALRAQASRPLWRQTPHTEVLQTKELESQVLPLVYSELKMAVNALDVHTVIIAEKEVEM